MKTQRKNPPRPATKTLPPPAAAPTRDEIIAWLWSAMFTAAGDVHETHTLAQQVTCLYRSGEVSQVRIKPVDKLGAAKILIRMLGLETPPQAEPDAEEEFSLWREICRRSPKSPIPTEAEREEARLFQLRLEAEQAAAKAAAAAANPAPHPNPAPAPPPPPEEHPAPAPETTSPGIPPTSPDYRPPRWQDRGVPAHLLLPSHGSGYNDDPPPKPTVIRPW